MERVDYSSLKDRLENIIVTFRTVEKRTWDKNSKQELNLEKKLQSWDKRIAQLKGAHKLTYTFKYDLY